MDNLNLIDELILGEQFNLDRENKEKLLLQIIKPQLENNCDNLNIRSMYEKLGININEIQRLEDVPYIPVNMFKEFNLSVCKEQEVVRVLTSSATTTGIPSKIYLDKKTSIRQTQGLISTISNFIGAERRPLLVIDSEDSNKRGGSITARGTAIRGVSTFASNITYVMDKELELDINKLYEFAEKYRNQEVLIYGFTYIVWSKFIKVLEEKGIKFDMHKIKLLHSGGWKKLISQKVEKYEFNIRTAKVFNTSPSNIIDFYGMVEQVGVVFLDCECGHKHIANFADVIIRDLESLEEVKPGGTGIIQVMSILGSSYPSQAILTEDIGELIGIDDCPCGRKGKYFKFKARVEKAEVRGCGDTFAEMEREI
ncbi:acyl-protein synthetase, LuxE [Clostridium homopropionicum DSM 5847]|uniref:Acyl-protein synthetase, LuxE n=1 Tax=Clostridium homopropionicum DSM 5847 TaxID=1121318 RepID=A0A0L6ZBK6_9CLOT|nr:acyl-protein synthetase [Clostridium homopropionicum]KOA20364.1 acyl-protein synthetase, LuxE [Clostridium homopropionicum DSM 5847]SFG74206.1 Acyl-protein synthetase, LuxE [Clostridium homopropionicum]